MTKNSGKINIKQKKPFLLTKGYSKSLQNLKQFIQSLNYAFISRKKKKMYIKSLWILRLNTISHMKKTNYSKFFGKLKKSFIFLNRKILNFLCFYDVRVINLLFRIYS